MHHLSSTLKISGARFEPERAEAHKVKRRVEKNMTCFRRRKKVEEMLLDAYEEVVGIIETNLKTYELLALMES